MVSFCQPGFGVTAEMIQADAPRSPVPGSCLGDTAAAGEGQTDPMCRVGKVPTLCPMTESPLC